MASLHPILKKSYWFLAILGGLWATFLILLINPTFQRHALYAHKIHTAFWNNISNPEEFGFAKGQVTPFNLTTSDRETLFCWHVLPLDVYLDNENEIVQKATGLVGDLQETIGYKLLQRDPKSRVVVNFHGNAGHVAQGYRPSTYRSLSGIPHTHVLTCDYRGFGHSTIHNPPHIPTEAGLITDGISLTSYLLTTLQHPADRTVLLGQSMGTVIASATALYFASPSTSALPPTIAHPSPLPNSATAFAGVILISPFPDLPELLQSYKISGFIPVLAPLKGYPKIANYLSSKIIDTWPTLPRLQALLTASAASKTPVHISILHARNDPDISFRLSEAVYAGLETLFLGDENVVASEERRTIHGGERVKRGAFAYRSVEDGDRMRSVELEIVRYGGHNEVVGWSQVSLAVRRAFKGVKSLRPGLDVE
ncbi:alpha/beta-hydrolase [Lophiostoma macrostomum CBS 122681]|uniref:Alpha/beta-hydrolase n=1 Tax=Lophiostoma macrostomum CBS 122681 TaxID=1314788 RepID=A0A6A6TIJ2_9PLEO|nr:alpha/beta-hydrolase [Lophiostoma macrostomum CBS 122681]